MNSNVQSHQHNSEDPIQLQTCIRNLLQAQPFAVLCTQGDSQPYGSIIAYTFNPDLKTAVFATARATRKYRLLTQCDRVALVIDSRSTYPDDLMQVEAITATGQARELTALERNIWADRLTDRHPQIEDFVTDASTALFKISIRRYLYVSRFQDVQYLDITTDAAPYKIASPPVT